MSLIEQIDQDIKKAMLAREKERLATLRDIKAKLLIEATSGKGAVDEALENQVILRLHKQRMESHDVYIEQDRKDLADVELAEAMQDFKVQAIRNNPLGFLDMYGQRQGKQRTDFANNISIWDDPDKVLIEKYTEISENSHNENYKKLASELIDKYKN